MADEEKLRALEERVSALEGKLLRVVRALISYTEKEKAQPATDLRMELYRTGVMPSVVKQVEKNK